MDLHSGHPFWLIKNGLPHIYPQLKKNLKTKVAIMGGGITGAIQAFYLAEAGLDCVVVEKRSIGLGSTCASTALLQYQIDTPLQELIEFVGKPHAVRAYELCAQSIDITEKMCKKVKHENFERKETVFYASYKKDIPLVEKEFELHKEAGFKVEMLTNKELKKGYGLDFPCGMRSQHSAQIDAYALCHQLLQYSMKKGTQVYDRTEISQISHGKNGVKLKTDDGFVIEADWLIYAVGYEVVNFLEKDIVTLNTTWAIVSEQFDDVKSFWKNNALLWETKSPYLYMRTTADNRIMLGGRDEEMNNPAKRADKMKDKSKKLADDFAKLFPQHAFRPEFEWAGTFGSTKDGLPYIGPYKPKPKGLFALGFGGNGITFSVIAAEILRDIIQGKENPDAEIFRFDR